MASARFFNSLMLRLRMKVSRLLLLVILFAETQALAQSSGHVLFGDIRVDESQATGSTMASFQVLLYSEAGGLLMRQTVSSNGRYRFLDLKNGRYQIVVEFENREIARIPVSVNSPFKTDFRQDIELQWKSLSSFTKTGVVSASDYYKRSAVNKTLLRQAREAGEKKQNDQAISLMRQIVDTDDGDFPVWEELGTNFFITKTFFEAESCYLKALQLRPDYLPAMVNLGRLRIVVKDLNGAVEILARAVKLRPTSPQANYFLGEAYLQVKLGSKGAFYLNEAIRLDPSGMADAHLRLAALYNAKDMKDKAANEYSEFLKQRPEYPEKKKLQQYIATYMKGSRKS